MQMFQNGRMKSMFGRMITTFWHLNMFVLRKNSQKTSLNIEKECQFGLFCKKNAQCTSQQHHNCNVYLQEQTWLTRLHGVYQRRKWTAITLIMCRGRSQVEKIIQKMHQAHKVTAVNGEKMYELAKSVRATEENMEKLKKFKTLKQELFKKYERETCYGVAFVPLRSIFKVCAMKNQDLAETEGSSKPAGREPWIASIDVMKQWYSAMNCEQRWLFIADHLYAFDFDRFKELDRNYPLIPPAAYWPSERWADDRWSEKNGYRRAVYLDVSSESGAIFSPSSTEDAEDHARFQQKELAPPYVDLDRHIALDRILLSQLLGPASSPISNFLRQNLQHDDADELFLIMPAEPPTPSFGIIHRTLTCATGGDVPEDGNQPIRTAYREVREELNLSIPPGILHCIMCGKNEDAKHDHMCVAGHKQNNSPIYVFTNWPSSDANSLHSFEHWLDSLA